MTGGIILDIIVAIILLLFVGLGIKKGLTVCLINVFSLLIAIVCAFMLCKPVGNALITHTEIDNSIKNTIKENLNIEGNVDLSESNLPSNVKEYIQKSVDEANQTKEEAIEGIANEIATNVVYIISFIAIFIVVRILLLVVKLLSNLITKLPIIGQIDKLGGAICGLIEGIIIIYSALTIISIASPSINNKSFIKYIDESFITKQIYNNNFVVKKVFKY